VSVAIDFRCILPGHIWAPDLFSRWFEGRGWAPRRHQTRPHRSRGPGQERTADRADRGGKTLAGFLPSLIELTERRQAGQDLAHAKGKGELHTLYISPLKALATDIRRNLEVPIAEMQLPVRAESRTGDTPQSRRLRQRERPPDFLLTTPESLALLLSYPDTAKFFANLRCVIVDELHTFSTSKRGHHLALCLARLAALARRHASSVCPPPSPIRRSWPIIFACATGSRWRSSTASPARRRMCRSSTRRSVCRGAAHGPARSA